MPYDCGDVGGGAYRSGVGERLDGAPAEPPPGDTDEQRDHDRRRRVRPRVTGRYRTQPDEHRDRGPHIRAEVQGIRLERFARSLRSDAVKDARAEEIDHDGSENYAERPDGRFDCMDFPAGQAVGRFPDDDAR